MISEDVPLIHLSSDQKIPAIGLGTWRVPKDVARETVIQAVKMGYRHIDCAWIYGNEEEIGEAFVSLFEDNTVTRDQLFITTKVFNNYHEERSVLSLRESLHKLKINYIDLLLIHWPIKFEKLELPKNKRLPDNTPHPDIIPSFEYLNTWKQFESFVEQGLVKSIGVSNFSIEQLECLMSNCVIKPTVHQIELHPYFNQTPLRTYCQLHEIVVESYSPLASGNDSPELPSFLKHPDIMKISTKYCKTPAQIVLRWNIENGVVPLPKSTNPDHIKENIEIFDFSLSKDEVQTIDNINIDHRYGIGWMKGHYY